MPAVKINKKTTRKPLKASGGKKKAPAGKSVNRKKRAAELARMRKKIYSYDEQILLISTKRMEVAKKIYNAKRDLNLPLRNVNVEKEVVEHFKTVAKRSGLSARFSTDLASILIGESVAQQALAPIKPEKIHKKAFILGGNGDMGRWMLKYLSRKGYSVAYNDYKKRQVARYKQMTIKDGCGWADFIVISTSPRGTLKAFKDVIACEPKGVIFDICSIKSELAEPFRNMAKKYNVTSVHPMFGPEIQLLDGCSIIICSCGNSKADLGAQSMFRDTGALISHVDVRKHDELISCILGASHLLNIQFFMTLQKSGHSFDELMKFASTTFLKQVLVSAAVAKENPSLYYDIQKMNRHTNVLFDKIEDSIRELRTACLDNDIEKFNAIMKEGNRYYARRSKR